MRSQSHVRSITRAAIVLAAIAIAVACSSSKTSSNSSSSGGDTGTVAAQDSSVALAKAEAATKVNFKGNYTNVSPESRPAAKNKSDHHHLGQPGLDQQLGPGQRRRRGSQEARLEGHHLRRPAEPVEVRPAGAPGGHRQARRHHPRGHRLPERAAAAPGGQERRHQGRGHLRLRLQRRPRRWRLVRALQRLDQLRRQGRQHRQVHRVLRRRPGPVHHRCDQEQGQDHRHPGPRVHRALLHAQGVHRHHQRLGRLQDRRHAQRHVVRHHHRQDPGQGAGRAAAAPRGRLGEEPLHLRHAAGHRPVTRCQGRHAARDGR